MHGRCLASVACLACASLASAQTWTPQRTPDGHPDLQGIWTNASITPLERPRELGAKEFYTEEEAAEKARSSEIRHASRKHFLGVPYDEVQESALAVSAEERRAVFDDRWNRGGFRPGLDWRGHGGLIQEIEVRESVFP